MKFSLVSCIAALAAISVAYAAEGDTCNKDKPCEVGCCMPRRPHLGGFGDMVTDFMDGMFASERGFFDDWLPRPPGGGRRPRPPRMMHGKCTLGNEGSDCMWCPDLPTTTPNPTSPSSDGSTTESSTTTDGSAMFGPGRWPWQRPPPPPPPGFPCCSCGEGLRCSMRTRKCVRSNTTISTREPTTVSTQEPTTVSTQEPTTVVA